MIRRSDEFQDICTSSADKALHEGRTLGPSMPLSEFPAVKTPPKYEAAFLRFMNPLLDAMREKGSQARPREIYDAVAQRLNLSEEERTVTNKNGYPRFENQIAWARSYLVKTG
jgi:hypothetical protein